MLENFRTEELVWDKASKYIYESYRTSTSDEHGRRLVVRVVNDGVVEDLRDYDLSLGWEHKFNGNSGLDAFEPVDAKNGIFEIYYTTGMMSNYGKLRANLYLTNGQDTITSEPFTIDVFKGVNMDKVEASDSFSTLSGYIVRLRGLEGNFNQWEGEEEDRQAREDERRLEEVSRRSNESNRKLNEEERVESENLRKQEEQSRVSVENSRETAEGNREIAENIRKDNEDERERNEDSRKDAEGERQANEASREEEEGRRVVSENERVVAEDGRITSENERVASENERSTEYTKRINQESERVNAENLRVQAEHGRESAEADREANEGNRETAEEGRVLSEQGRESAEQERVDNENARNNTEADVIESESLRKEAELGRVNAEEGRVASENIREQEYTTSLANEDERVLSEQGRDSAEADREANEGNRITAEQGRESAEADREANEDERVANETSRKDAEETRVGNEEERILGEASREIEESARLTAEQGRESAETGRVNAETERVTAEQGRESAEQERGVRLTGIEYEIRGAIQEKIDEKVAEAEAMGKDVDLDSKLQDVDSFVEMVFDELYEIEISTFPGFPFTPVELKSKIREILQVKLNGSPGTVSDVNNGLEYMYNDIYGWERVGNIEPARYVVYNKDRRELEGVKAKIEDLIKGEEEEGVLEYVGGRLKDYLEYSRSSKIDIVGDSVDYMFNDTVLTHLPELKQNETDNSYATNAEGMFEGATIHDTLMFWELAENIKPVNARSMFKGVRVSEGEWLNLTNFDFSDVSEASYMFENTDAKSIYLSNIKGIRESGSNGVFENINHPVEIFIADPDDKTWVTEETEDNPNVTVKGLANLLQPVHNMFPNEMPPEEGDKILVTFEGKDFGVYEVVNDSYQGLALSLYTPYEEGLPRMGYKRVD